MIQPGLESLKALEAHSITAGAGCGRQTRHNQPSIRSRHTQHFAGSSSHADQHPRHQPHDRINFNGTASWRYLHKPKHLCSPSQQWPGYYCAEQQHPSSPRGSNPWNSGKSVCLAAVDNWMMFEAPIPHSPSQELFLLLVFIPHAVSSCDDGHTAKWNRDCTILCYNYDDAISRVRNL